MEDPNITQTPTDYARLGTALALDRTLLAWIRTALTLIGFGFTLAKFVHDLLEKGVLHGVPPYYPRTVGFALMVLGLFTLVGGAVEYIHIGKRVFVGKIVLSISLGITVSLIVLGMILIVGLLSELTPV